MTNSITKKIAIAEFIGLIFCLGMSVVFHFAFEWLGKSPYAAAFFATNESVWEHGKIIFYPFVLYSIVEYFILKPDPKVYATAKCIPLAAAIPTMITLFYTYSGIIGRSIVAVDITIAVLIIFAMYGASYSILKNGCIAKSWPLWAAISLITLLLLIIFTFYPPHIPLFYDFPHNVYGIKR